jgi:hypothetical protein
MKRELLMRDDLDDEASIVWTIVDAPPETTRVHIEEKRGESFGRSLATWIVILTAGVLLGANLQSVAGGPRIEATTSPIADLSISARPSVEVPTVLPADRPAAMPSVASSPACIPFDYRPVACPRSSATNRPTQPSRRGPTPA